MRHEPVHVTTLIPAFKHEFFEQLLVALNAQVVKPDRIIISDDSKEDLFLSSVGKTAFRELFEGLNIEIVQGPKKGQYANFRHLVKLLTDEDTCFHILCDDDIIDPGFYQMHRKAQASSDALCSFSKRRIARANGLTTSAGHYPPAITRSRHKMMLLETEFLYRSTLPAMNNWLGEFSNTVLKNDAISFFLQPSLNGICHYGLYDLGIFLRASEQNGSILINEYLGAFRQSPSQYSSQTGSPTYRSSILAWIALSIAAYRGGRLTKEQLFSCAATATNVLKQYFMEDPDAKEILALEDLILQRAVEPYIESFLSIWPIFLRHIDQELMRPS